MNLLNTITNRRRTEAEQPVTAAEFSWGQSVSVSGGVVNIPPNSANGERAAALLIVNRGDVETLRNMLDGVLRETGVGDA